MQRNEEWRTARQSVWRFLGISGASDVAPWKLIAALIVVGAAVIAVSHRHSITVYIGGALWLAGAVMAILGYVGLMRSRRFKSN